MCAVAPKWLHYKYAVLDPNGYIVNMSRWSDRTRSYHTVFFHTHPQAVHLHNLTQKSNVLLINGNGYGRVGLYSNKQISYQGQPKVIAKFDNSSSSIKQLLRISGI